MKIIVCNDTRTESFPDDFDWQHADATRRAQTTRENINLDSMLCKKLRKAGHGVVLFDGYEKNAIKKITDHNRGASHLTQLIAEFQATGMVFDLHYFGDFEYGVLCLKQLRKYKALPIDMKFYVYSRFVKEPKGDYPRRLVEDCNIPLGNIIDRHQHDIDKIVSLFGTK